MCANCNTEYNKCNKLTGHTYQYQVVILSFLNNNKNTNKDNIAKHQESIFLFFLFCIFKNQSKSRYLRTFVQFQNKLFSEC